MLYAHIFDYRFEFSNHIICNISSILKDDKDSENAGRA